MPASGKSAEKSWHSESVSLVISFHIVRVFLWNESIYLRTSRLTLLITLWELLNRVHSVEQLAERHNHSLHRQRVQELSTREVEGKPKLASLLLASPHSSRYEWAQLYFTVPRVQLLLHQTAFSQQSLRQYILTYCIYSLHSQTVCYLLWGWSSIIRSPSVDGHANGLRCLATSQIQITAF